MHTRIMKTSKEEHADERINKLEPPSRSLEPMKADNVSSLGIDELQGSESRRSNSGSFWVLFLFGLLFWEDVDCTGSAAIDE